MKIMDSNACRLCLSSEDDQLMNIFSSIGMELKMDKIISEHFKSDIREADPLPNVVCQMCWSTTENFHELYEKSKAVQKKFLDALIKSETESDPIDVWPIDIKEIHDENCFIEEPHVYVEPVKIEFNEENSDDECVNDDAEKFPKCKPCDETSASENEQKEGRIQLKPKKYKCSHCGKMLCSIRMLNRHFKRMHPEVTVPKLVRNRHKEKKKSEEETKFIADNFDLTCDQCDAVFASLYDAQLHYKDIHDELKGYVKCCDTKLKTDWEVRDHIKFHVNPETFNNFRCDICGKSNKSRMILINHKRRHKPTVNLSFICDFCGRKCQSKVAITRHIFSQHVKSEPKYECEICHKKFQLRGLLRSHHFQAHREKKRSITCEICGKSFHSKCYLDKHMLSHTDKSERLAQRQQCEHCGEWLMTKSGVFYHKQIHTSGIQKCSQCGTELPNKPALLKHIRTCHREHKFKCSFCEKTFAIGSELKKHEEIHTRHRVYTCKFCPMTYTSSFSLQTHTRRNHYEENKLYRAAKKLNTSNI